MSSLTYIECKVCGGTMKLVARTRWCRLYLCLVKHCRHRERQDLESYTAADIGRAVSEDGEFDDIDITAEDDQASEELRF